MGMFVPVIRPGHEDLEFINVELVKRLEPGDAMIADEAPPEDGKPQHVMPDGNPWPTTWLHFTDGDSIRVKGSAQQLLSQWFRPPAPPEQSRQQRRAEQREAAKQRIVVPGIQMPKGPLRG